MDYKVTGLAASTINWLPKQTTLFHLTQIHKTLMKQTQSGHKNGLGINRLQCYKCDLQQIIMSSLNSSSTGHN
jgi:hypothetical protein